MPEVLKHCREVANQYSLPSVDDKAALALIKSNFAWNELQVIVALTRANLVDSDILCKTCRVTTQTVEVEHAKVVLVARLRQNPPTLLVAKKNYDLVGRFSRNDTLKHGVRLSSITATQTLLDSLRDLF